MEKGLSVPDKFRPRQVIVQKQAGVKGFGFHVRSYPGTVGEFDISKVVVNSPADMAGLLHGDQLIQVNGAPVRGDTQLDVDAKIRENGDSVQMVVISPEGKRFFLDSRVDIRRDFRRHVIRLAKVKTCLLSARDGFKGYGFSLLATSDMRVYVSHVEERSPAEEAGVKAGDRLMRVNAVDVSEDSEERIYQRVTEIDGEVWLTLVTETHRK